MRTHISQQVFDRWLRRIAAAVFVVALLIAAFTRLVTVFRYVGFQDDQAYNAMQMLQMRNDWLSLGPLASIHQYHLPPLYYYLSFPFALIGSDPVWQALPNALFSFLSIPLLALFVFVVLDRLSRAQRFFFASLAALWWSLFFKDILLSNVEWNPSSIPFFFLGTMLLFALQMSARRLRTQTALWIASGAVLAILMSLHSTTLFVMPVAFILTGAWFVWQHRRQWYWPLVGLAVAILMLAPYWKGEMRTGWQNTRAIVATVQENQQTPHTLLERADRAVFNFVELGPLAYFPFHADADDAAVVFLLLGVVVCVLRLRGNTTVLGFFAITLLVYSAVASNFWGTYFYHYKILFSFAPIVFTVWALSTLVLRRPGHAVVGIVLVFGMLLSMVENGSLDLRYAQAKYGENRLMTVNDTLAALRTMPMNATLCVRRDELQAFSYLDTQMTRRKVQLTERCTFGSYQILPRCTDPANFTMPLVCMDALPPNTEVVQRANVWTLVRYTR